MHSSSRFLVFVSLILLSGCTTEEYDITTEIESDGAIARKVIQPASERLPDAGRKNWTKTRIAFDYDSAVSGVEKPNPNNEVSTNEYFVAEGTFKSVASIPEHYEQKSVDGSRTGRLKRDYTKNDYGFFVEHIWSEELTDPVKPEEFPEAVKELAHFAAGLNELGLREYLGNDINIQPMTEWIENDGAALFLEFLLVAVHLSGRNESDVLNEAEGLKRLKTIAKRHGIEIEGDEFEKSFDRFVRAELPKRIRYMDGRPLEDEHMRIILRFYGMERDEGEEENACSAAFERAIERKYGDDFEKEYAVFTPLLGVYGDRILGTPQSFDFSLKLPGLIVETNGVLASDSKVRWKFDAADASLLGYQMKCRSVERIDKVCDQILKPDSLRSRAEMIRLLDLAQDEEVRTTLLKVVKKGSGLFDLPDEVREILQRK